MADGIALVFQNIGSNVTGNAGGDVGYWNLGGHSGSAAVGSVIRSWDNNEYGISTDGVVQGLNKASWNFGALNDVTGTQTITYNATTHVLSMTGSFSDALGHTLNVSDSDTVDLSAKFGSTMYVGFTGATGGADADQRITGFSVSAVPEPETYAMLMAGLGLVGFAVRRRKAA
ncbi:PEP-CTERM sorting domain-containing protein [Duganella sp. SAP-35]|uniref:PEP-CTERM sorting domain-containing protein n=2 Tax=Duganella aceris TaxID=2703883 RepID=A0ABX0FNH4_9BURK|nr:PEP-CTERM sorting domain-containing protein [Duganella aceris]